jgi:glutamine synthetase type III
VEKEIYKRLNFASETLYARLENLRNGIKELPEDDQKQAQFIADNLMPIADEMAELSNELEEMTPEDHWNLPKYFDMLFLR